MYIEGTVCPITFVKDTLFPYFIEKLPSILDKFQYPLSNTSASSDDQVLNILKQLPDNITKSSESIYKHFKNLVDQDIKDPILKSLQGLIWKQDSIEFIESFPTKSSTNNKIYIYSSGSIKAQILLFAITNEVIDLNPKLNGYFDITTAGFKNQSNSYKKILQEINKSSTPKSVLFLSDNINEVNAAIEAGMKSYIVIRPGNPPIDDDDDGNDDKINHKIIYSLDELDL
ncbi:2,3-diketo-5-methylthio-1-phosphopentane phosphatase [Candida albicans]|uniref:Enolase-phosphatase E1 n=1 Tax=Candida albicans TaxID=5476 RepID=A0A8H6BXL6_CANAX|nr:2,3-diketo-5-methylthio-1-phosphopentane phosphatase [Candida albicans]